MAGKGLDDFFITYRYALHLAQGQGLVFNPGERVFGLTNPGFALLLAALHVVTRVSVPALATGVFGLSLLAVAVLMLADARGHGRLPEAAVGGSLLVGSSYLWAQQGGEGIPMTALLLGAASLAQGHPALAGLLAGSAVWFRPEAGLGVALLCLILWTEERRLPMRLGAAAAGIVLTGVLQAWWYYGSPVPTSLAAKQAIASHLLATWSGRGFWPRAAWLVPRHAGPLWALLVALGVAGAVPLWRHGGLSGRLLALTAGTLAVAYPLTGVPFAPWYTAPIAAGVLYGLPYLFGALLRTSLARLATAPLRLAVGIALGFLFTLPLAVSLLPASFKWHREFDWPPFMERYRLAGLWLRDHAPSGATVACFEVGALGYYSDRRIVDLLGIVTPAMLPYVRARDFAGAFLAKSPDYAVYDEAREARSGWMPTSRPWFESAYQCAARLGEGRDHVLVYQRRRSVPLPRPGPPQDAS
ncbi:MAG TPA: hypothetical protein VHQ90_05000 [Thermoanaerobaculia bacterium]|nr:hypothetical protein [Thermoanaerobaculia bacterium]